jgi:hypothetical protein
MAWPPQLPQMAAWNSRGAPTVRARLATARQDGHRWGSLSRPLLEKNDCSPLEKVNSPAQSRQTRLRSWNTLACSSCSARSPRFVRGPPRESVEPSAPTGGCAPTGRAGLGPGTHEGQNSGGVKHNVRPNFADVDLICDEHRRIQRQTRFPRTVGARAPVPTCTGQAGRGNRLTPSPVGAPCQTD